MTAAVTRLKECAGNAIIKENQGNEMTEAHQRWASKSVLPIVRND